MSAAPGAELPMGKIIGEPNDIYHASPAISVSKLKVFRHSPALYQGRFLTKTIPPPEPTPALLFGSAAGTRILEGTDVYASQYYTVPKGVGRVRVGDKAIREKLEAENPGKLALSWNDATAIARMNANVHAHRFAGPLLAACKPEITWRIRGENFAVQVRTDGFADEGCELTQGAPYICDAKTIAALPDDEPEVISKQIADFWYHGQAYAYREIVSAVMKWPAEFRPRFFFIFVAKEEPFNVKVVELDDVTLGLAERQVIDTMERLKSCTLKNEWPQSWEDTHLKDVPKVSVPAFYLRRELGDERSNLW